MTKPGILSGALVGALVTAPLIAAFTMVGELAGLPIIPFDLFDWVARLLPGAVITFGIDLIVRLITDLDLGATADTAKLAEQLLALAGSWLVGMVLGVLVFAAWRSDGRDSHRIAGVVLGALVGGLALFVSININTAATASSVISGVWVLAVYLLWGFAIGSLFDRLAELPPPTPATARAADEDGETAAVAPVSPAYVQRAPSVEMIDRRQFLVRVGGATAVITLIGGGLSLMMNRAESSSAAAESLEAAGLRLWSAGNTLPNAGAVPEPAPGTRPEFTPLDTHYRIDINLSPPRLDAAAWRLLIGGEVENPLELTLDAIRNNYEALHQFITLSCISNPVGGDLIGTQRWTGVSMQRILQDVRPTEAGAHLKIRSADGFDEYLALSQIMRDERIMLCYEWDGIPLTHEHGFPLRIYIPDVYGMKQPKWITNIDFVPGWEAGYWVRRGWDAVARMNATAVIDRVAVDAVYEAGGRMFVPIGGIAHAGTRGVSTVEVRVDDGPWQEAELREPISHLTWTLWRFDWPFEGGEHAFRVRSEEGDGTPQIEAVRGTRPSGATGYHSLRTFL